MGGRRRRLGRGRNLVGLEREEEVGGGRRILVLGKEPNEEEEEEVGNGDGRRDGGN